jgi:tubulin polyglutamylase TTLL6/13
LIDNLKFDFRLYVLLSGVDPLRILLYKEGFARFATEPYQPPTVANIEDHFMHLTNYALQKNSEKYVFNENEQADGIGHKRSLESVLEIIEQDGFNTTDLMAEIKSIIIKTIITA